MNKKKCHLKLVPKPDFKPVDKNSIPRYTIVYKDGKKTYEQVRTS